MGSKNSPEQQIIILGLGKRYAIENYIFEPHFLGLYLIHKKFVKPNELGLVNCNSYLDVTKAIEADNDVLQIIADHVHGKIEWENENNYIVESELLNGYKLQVRKDSFEMKGHKLEEIIKNTWPMLKSVRNNNFGDSVLKKDIINTVINDFPSLLSVDISNTFISIS
ncbi:hypothetical protein ABQG55_14260 [Aeromonas dhakensis]|uniref:hypothetical protein n=1 Tax=Aeromonas dhakensis TaxID=196024 RepID=UPI0032EF22E4